MPTLKQLTCNVEWSASGPSIPLQEYGTTYFDGLVETWIAVPPVSTPFSVGNHLTLESSPAARHPRPPSAPVEIAGAVSSHVLRHTTMSHPVIRLRSDGYIAPGLSMFVYIDGEYQCNRGRNNLKVPTSTTQKHHTNVDFVVRQKEESLSDGNFLGRQWIFGNLDGASNIANQGYSHSVTKEEHMATIEVVVLRSIELQRPKAPVPSASELHPITFKKPDSPNFLSSESAHSSSPDVHTVMSDFGGLFDGTSDIKERYVIPMPFGGDMAWDDNDQQNRGQHFSTDWSGGSQQQNAQNNHRGDRSYAPSRSSSIPAASPAVQIFVNQPAASSPAPWSAAEPRQWRRAPGSVADSWGTPAHGSQTGHGQATKPRSSKHKNSPQKISSSSSDGSKKMNTNGGGWDNNNDNGWAKSTDQPTKDQSQNVPGAWDASTKGKQPQSGSYGWDKSGGASANWNGTNSKQDNNGWNVDTVQGTGGQNNDAGWDNNNEANNNQQDTGWVNGNNDGNDQGNWGSNGQNSTPNDDWGGGNNGGDADDNNGENEGWDSGQNDQMNQEDNGQNGEGWNANDGNGQGDSGWNNTGQGGSNDNQHYNNFGGGPNHGDAWDNAKVGAKGTQASHAPNWSTSNQNGWNQNGGANDMLPATTGVSDPAKTRSRRASTNLSRQATMNSVAQKTGRKYSNSVHGSGGGFAQPGQQQTGPPGAWPDTSQNAAGLNPFQSGPAAGIKPYHVIPDAAGNPRLPILTPVSPIVEVPAPTPPPVKLGETSHHVQRGSPALYQHKTASPRYIDTHDKPYASFIFKYRPKAILEQMLNLTIPDTDDIEKAKLAHLSKEELIEQVIKTKSQFGSKMSSTISSLSAMPPSVNTFANGGNRDWGANQNGGNIAPQNNNNNGWNASNGGNYGNRNTGPGPSGGAFATNLNNKLAALAGQNNNSNRSSGSSNHNQGWNNGPPGSPSANNGNTNLGGPPAGGSGGLIDTWLSKTPVGASFSGHKPWNGASSVKNSGGSNPGGNAGNCGGNQMNNDAHGGWNGSNKGHGGNTIRTRSQKAGAKSQKSGGGWKDNNGGGGWTGNGNNNGGGGTQTADWNNGNNNGGWNEGGNGNGWNGGNNQSGDQANNWDGGNHGNGGGGRENNNGNGNGNQQQAAAVGGW